MSAFPLLSLAATFLVYEHVVGLMDLNCINSNLSGIIIRKV